ncbi:phosphoribosylformylglycinamidine cyclo-ligase [Planomonospora sp. ID82291]|uniref:phosphoribosylformylglycinamidine cyclo-ligase n=1 Tax=Planomonospora sp. ID82291 TaxID=2738136 RepID=UPI0018C39658|nr:phosphoribosylformylglycinamidine cyclo-ligase [Planomonospora sp. ID82291]MBG0814692.1 phosphoribosylformylglycinamidine cyclo-ligase [Planomonospora sp. ID82291]
MTSYAAAGVDIDAGERAVELMKAKVARSRRPEVVDDASGFAGLFDASALLGYRRPLLTTSTDGVGTKVMLAQQLGRHDTIGIDLVGMVVDDLVVCGAEPLFMTDYIACGKVVPERIAEIVGGVAEGCRLAGTALIGGETAEHPGAMGADEYDLAGAATGVVEADAMLGRDRVRAGDVVLALASSGVHSNGYSLVRHIIRLAGLSLERQVPEFGRTLGEELLEPTRIYALDCLALARSVEVHAYAHITGGGLEGNLSRSLPPELDALLDRSSWTPPAVFGVLAGHGKVAQADMDRTFNLGVGMAAIVPADAVDPALALLKERGLPAWVLGEIVPGAGRARYR